MSSYERKCTSAYSEDLRWRIVWQKEALGFSTEDVAANLGVDVTTVWRVAGRFEETGDVKKKAYSSRRLQKMSSTIQFAIVHSVLRRPGIYLREIQSEIIEEYGEELSLSFICEFLHKVGFTRQRLKITATQQDYLLRSQFVSDVSVYAPEMLIFLDETGSDRRDCIRHYGYSLRGRPLITQRLSSRGDRINVIAYLSMYGLLDCKAVTHTIDGDTFYDFVQSSLLPNSMPFDGYNHLVL